MAEANCPLRLCDQSVTGRGPHPSFRARIMMREAQTATRRFGTFPFKVSGGVLVLRDGGVLRDKAQIHHIITVCFGLVGLV